uniref:MPA2 allergen n=1 Tax=Periplaneta americana TaxID=6978 RepID=Q1M0Y0_PERAM|nr:MPA2 allergen [Periplaneta americana]
MALRYLLVALLASSAAGRTVNTCSSGPAPYDVRVKGCDAQPCVLHHGTNAEAEVDFSAVHDISHMKPQVRATVFGGTVEFQVPEQNACNSLLNSACPLEEGDMATYQLILPIEDYIPSVDVNVELSLIDTDTNDVVFCFSVDTQVI